MQEDKARMLEMAFKYTNGDVEKAKAMVTGQYNDIVAIKAKIAFHKSGKSGMLMGFFNVNFRYVASLDIIIMSNSDLYNRVRVFSDWKSLYKDLTDYKKDDAIIKNPTLLEKLHEKLSEPAMLTNVVNKSLDDITKFVNNSLNDIFPGDRISSQLELEETSSVALGGAGIYINMPQSAQPAAPASEPKPAPEAATQDLSPFEAKLAEIEAEAEHIVEGVSVISPVKGKFIADLVPGDIVMVLLPKGDAISKKILETIKAIGDDGSIKPVRSRLKYKVVDGKGPYYIYVLVAKGVYAKLIEEENVKIRVEFTGNEKTESKGSYKFLFIAIGFIAFLVLAGLAFVKWF